MKHSTDSGMASLEASRDKLSQDIAAVAGEAADLIRNASSRNVERAQEALASARDALRSGSSDMVDATGNYVRSNPLQALGAAAVVGLLLGVVLARR